MINLILKWMGRIFPYGLGIYLFLFSTASLNGIKADMMSIQEQNHELYINQSNIYKEYLKIESANIIVQTSLIDGLDKAKADAVKRNDEIMKLVYGVNKESLNRDKSIVEAVNTLVDGVTRTSQKPSYDYLKSITVFILSVNKEDPKKGWIGTGVIVRISDKATYIVTNRHVAPGDSDNIYYVIEGGSKYKLVNIKVSKDEKIDLSLNKVDEVIPGKRAVIGIADTKAQDDVYMVGQNLGRPFLYAEGTVSGFDETDESLNLVIGLPSGPGNSGSGVINNEGKLVGLLYAGAIIAEDSLYQMDTSHGECMNSKVLRLFLAGYID